MNDFFYPVKQSFYPLFSIPFIFVAKFLDRIITNRVLTKQTSKWNKRDFYSVS